MCKSYLKGVKEMKKPTVEELLKQIEGKEVQAEWDRRDELMKRFNGLSKSTLNTYQKEMEEIPEFKEGVLKPTHSVTWINLALFILFLKWKEENRYRTRKVSAKDFLLKLEGEIS
ncbi:hypothetical protein RV18_GL001993 [Enterococcus termitis]|nr:hypothetical protein RV18_GL001993 [Enterococcus termitis]